MDTSPEYIKMCEKAEEIQKLRNVSNGAYFAPCFTYHENDVRFNPAGNKPAIWLPRQDQLQEMFSSSHPLELVDKFHTFCMWDEQLEDMREMLSSTSMEQLWLTFVMKEKYNKTWTGEEWANA